MDENIFTVDKTLNIQVDYNKYLNESNALIQLKTGLIALYNTIRPLEIDVLNKRNELGMRRSTSFGFDPDDPIVPVDVYNLMPCLFHWFGVSLCNYTRLAGYIVAREQGHVQTSDLQLEPERKKIKDACNNYVNAVPEIKEVLKWRNKVAAHFALTDPRNDDNIASMEASIVYPVGFMEGRFRTGTITLMKGGDSGIFNSEIPSWSLTETFEALVNRFGQMWYLIEEFLKYQTKTVRLTNFYLHQSSSASILLILIEHKRV